VCCARGKNQGLPTRARHSERERENRSAHHQRAWLLQPWNPWTLRVTHASSRHPKTLYDSASSLLRRSNGAPPGGRVTATVRCWRCCWGPSRPVPTARYFAATESCQIWTRHFQAENIDDVSFTAIFYLAFDKSSSRGLFLVCGNLCLFLHLWLFGRGAGTLQTHHRIDN
jgi:hypothetical protein